MVCRHKKGDPACSSTVGGYAWQEAQEYSARSRRDEEKRKMRKELEEELRSRSPNPENFEIIDFEEVCQWLVLKVKYPNSCAECEFDNCKIMVFQDCSIRDLVLWKIIDPHFKNRPKTRTEAPMPRARFPGDEQGWEDAKEFARRT